TAIQGAGIADLRVIGDVLQDGVAGVSANVYMVRKDSPVQKVEDLKGRVVGINAKGGLLDIGLRAMLQKHGLDEDKDLSVVEISFPNMKATLLDRKVEMIGTVLPFLMDPQLQANARILFTAFDAAGREQMSTLVTRAEFIAQNRAVLVDFMEDYIRAVRWFTDPANHQQAVAIVADFTKQPAATLDSWLFTHTDQYHNPNALPDAELLQQNVDLLQRLGYAKAKLDMRQYVDPSLAREAVARVGAAPNRPP